MNEMTVPKITLLLDTFAKACGDNSKAKELCREAINFIVKQEREGEVIAVLAEARRIALEQQQQQIEQQAAEIAASEQKYKNWIGPIEHKSLLDEIAKKDRMIEILIDKLIEDIGECPSVGNCHVNFDGKSDDESNEICRKCWLAWLEKEAQGVE